MEADPQLAWAAWSSLPLHQSGDYKTGTYHWRYFSRVCRLDSWPDSISVAVGFRHTLAVDETLSASLMLLLSQLHLGSLANKHRIWIYGVIVDRRAKELVPSRDE